MLLGFESLIGSKERSDEAAERKCVSTSVRGSNGFGNEILVKIEAKTGAQNSNV